MADEIFADEILADEIFADEIFTDEIFAEEGVRIKNFIMQRVCMIDVFEGRRSCSLFDSLRPGIPVHRYTFVGE